MQGCCTNAAAREYRDNRGGTDGGCIPRLEASSRRPGDLPPAHIIQLSGSCTIFGGSMLTISCTSTTRETSSRVSQFIPLPLSCALTRQCCTEPFGSVRSNSVPTGLNFGDVRIVAGRGLIDKGQAAKGPQRSLFDAHVHGPRPAFYRVHLNIEGHLLTFGKAR
jgi:hypothetical protein